jgi:hypothetical protein
MNSSIEITEAAKLADKLIARTREGRLTWEATGIGMVGAILGTTDLSLATAFTTTLEGNLKATVSVWRSGQDEKLTFSLIEFDPRRQGRLAMPGDEPSNPDKDVLSVAVEKDPSYGYDSVDEKQLAGLLIDLYGLARRSALKIDKSVQKALTYLDKIAV